MWKFKFSKISKTMTISGDMPWGPIINKPTIKIFLGCRYFFFNSWIVIFKAVLLFIPLLVPVFEPLGFGDLPSAIYFLHVLTQSPFYSSNCIYYYITFLGGNWFLLNSDFVTNASWSRISSKKWNFSHFFLMRT